MVEKINELNLLYLIDDKIFNIYTMIKEKIYDGKNYNLLLDKLNILIKLENDELNKLELDYYYLEDLKEKILKQNDNWHFDDWDIETSFLSDILISNQSKDINGKKLFKYDMLTKNEIIFLRIYQKLNLLQTKCLNYPFKDISDLIIDEEYSLIPGDDDSVYLDDIEKATGIYTDYDFGCIDCDSYVEEALKVDHVLVLDSAFRERLFLEVKADILLNNFITNSLDKENNLDIKNFYIDNMFNMVYITPLLEDRLININFDLNKTHNYFSNNIYKNRANLKFLDIIRKRKFVSKCDKLLEKYNYYDDYNLFNYNSPSFKDNNVIVEFANINMLISSIKACFNNQTRGELLYQIFKFKLQIETDDNQKLFNKLMESIGEQESNVKTFKLK